MGAAGAVAAAASFGAGVAFVSYLWIDHSIATAYQTRGPGEFKADCQAAHYSEFPKRCLDEHPVVLMGDSLAASLLGGFARGFHEFGLNVVYMGRGGCDPLLFAPALRPTVHGGICGRLFTTWDQLRAHPAQRLSVIVMPRMVNTNTVAHWTELVAQFDPVRTRILLLSPTPPLRTPALDCVVLSERYGLSPERCGRPRTEVEAALASIDNALKATAARTPDKVHHADLINVFCDATICRPLVGHQLMYEDHQHLFPSGVDLVWKSLERELRWVAWKD